MTNSSYSKSRLVVPGSENALSQMKYEIANELGVNLGPDASARQNGSVGGEMTKRLVELGERYYTNTNGNLNK